MKKAIWLDLFVSSTFNHLPQNGNQILWKEENSHDFESRMMPLQHFEEVPIQ
jgi:hypothetical protein